MRLDKALNLVIPIDNDDGRIYVHSTPVSREVFEKYFLAISKTFAAIYSEGLNVLAGPRVAALMLRQVSKDLDIDTGLIDEIRRLSNVIVAGKPVPLEVALNQGVLSAEDYHEAEGMIVFFICVSAMHKRSLVASILAEMCGLWASGTTLSNCTEYANSLPTSIETASSGETVTPSVIPS